MKLFCVSAGRGMAPWAAPKLIFSMLSTYRKVCPPQRREGHDTFGAPSFSIAPSGCGSAISPRLPFVSGRAKMFTLCIRMCKRDPGSSVGSITSNPPYPQKLGCPPLGVGFGCRPWMPQKPKMQGGLGSAANS